MINRIPALTKGILVGLLFAPVMMVASAQTKDVPSPAPGKVAVKPAGSSASLPERVTTVPRRLSFSILKP